MGTVPYPGPGIAPGGPAPGSVVGPSPADWFAQQGTPPAVPVPAPGPTGSAGMQAALETSPGYQFRLGEGLKALERSAAARGTLLTGGTMKGLQRYAQDYASGEYQNRYNQLFGLAGIGQNAAGAQAGQNSQYASTAGDLMTQQGNAQAAGTVGSANAWNQGLNNASNMAQMIYLSQMMQPGGGGQNPGQQIPGWQSGYPYTLPK